MDQLRQQHPQVRFTRLPTAGEDPRLTQLLAELALENPA
jgi:sirohydrochlorin cobaltochelatase